MTLGGIIFIRNGDMYDYCYRESIACLQALCDKVVVLDAGSTDGTAEVVQQYEDQNTTVICLGEEEWDKQQGREKLSYFQNLALSFLDTDYYFLLQGDEILHESCFQAVREAIETGADCVFVKRINLWRDCNSFINVEHNRQPCGTSIIRLAKTKYKSVGDGECIENSRTDNIGYVGHHNQIRIYHYGFVRKREVMKEKIINMQENVFQLGLHDPKLDGGDVFDSELWFSGNELSPITEEHSKFIKSWAISRP